MSTPTAPTWRRKIAPGFAAEVERQFDQDIPIWEAKSYVAVAGAGAEREAGHRVPPWAAQFYPET